MATKCCEDSDVPESCLGLCSPTDAMSRSILGESLNSCAKYKASIEKCFEPVVQGDISTKIFLLVHKS